MKHASPAGERARTKPKGGSVYRDGKMSLPSWTRLGWGLKGSRLCLKTHPQRSMSLNACLCQLALDRTGPLYFGDAERQGVQRSAQVLICGILLKVGVKCLPRQSREKRFLSDFGRRFAHNLLR